MTEDSNHLNKDEPPTYLLKTKIPWADFDLERVDHDYSFGSGYISYLIMGISKQDNENDLKRFFYEHINIIRRLEKKHLKRLFKAINDKDLPLNKQDIPEVVSYDGR